jgi:hypothetical protein
MWQIGGDPIMRVLQTLHFDLALLQIPREDWFSILICLNAQRSRPWRTVERRLHILIEPSQARQAFEKAFCRV